MEAGSIIRSTMTVSGIVILVSGFWLLAIKRLTADLAVLWEIAGVMLTIAGFVFRLPEGMQGMGRSGELFLACMGTVGLCACGLFGLAISRLKLSNHELAIEVSLLLGENGREGGETKKDLLIILPVKNEEKNVAGVLEQLSRPHIKDIADILCINDASTDASGQVIDRYPCMQITSVFGLGYGSALQLGYKYALRRGYQFVIQMDADGQHDVCNIPLIYEKLRENEKTGGAPDIVLASRFMEGSTDFPVSVFKKFAFWLFRSIIRVATGQYVADPTTGLQGLSRRAFEYYSRYNNFDYQYPDANMVMQMLLLKFRLAQVPAVMHVRTDGRSMHSGLEPAGYMVRMLLSVFAVIFRIKVLRMK